MDKKPEKDFSVLHQKESLEKLNKSPIKLNYSGIIGYNANINAFLGNLRSLQAKNTKYAEQSVNII